MLICILCSSLFSIFLVKKLFDYLFPSEMNMFYLDAGLYGLNLYAPVYLKLEQMYNKYKAFIMDRITSDTAMLMFIKNGRVINEFNLNEMNLIEINPNEKNLMPTFFDYYDLILLKEPLRENALSKYKYRLTRLQRKSDLVNLPQPSTLRFLDIKVLMNQEKYTLNFDKENFYIEGNILCDKIFLQWYLKEYFKVALLDTYKCIIMDQNIDLITLDINNAVEVTSDDYIVKTIGASEAVPSEAVL